MIALVVASALAVGLDEHVGDPVPRELPFTDTTGARVELGRYLGHKPVVLVMAYARCEMLCSVVLRGAATAMQGEPVATSRRSSSASIRPRRPTRPPVARPRSSPTSARPTARAGRTSSATTPRSTRSRTRSASTTRGTSARSSSRIRPSCSCSRPTAASPSTSAASTFDGLDDAIDRAARGELTTSTAQDLLRCFHDDPALRRYEARLQLAFRIAGGAVLLALAGIVIGLVRWERRR